MTGHERITGLVRLRVSLIYPEIAVFQFGLFAAMIYRALDYITPPDEVTASLSVVEQALPFHVWGLLQLACGVVGLVGLRWIRVPLSALAHGGAVALYAAFAVGSLLSILERIDRTPSPLVLGWVTLAGLAAVATVAIVEWKFREWRTAAWVLLAATASGIIIALAGASGVYGWRTATDWIFVMAVGHAVMADASFDAWRDQVRHDHVKEDLHADTAV